MKNGVYEGPDGEILEPPPSKVIICQKILNGCVQSYPLNPKNRVSILPINLYITTINSK